MAKVQRHLEDALQRGGKIVTGGKSPARPVFSAHRGG